MLLHLRLVAVLALLLSTGALATESWLYSGRIAGTYVYKAMSEADLIALLDQRAAENVSILELDSRLSYYLSDEDFDAEVAFLDRVATLANARGMQAVIYYPSLEVLTANAIDDNGVIAESTFARDHPDWLQHGIDGTPNVFYGGQEVWVSGDEESAWASPNSGYKAYLIERVEKLAATELDGVWLDVPIYLDTGTPWTGAEPAAAADFNAWTVAEGLNGGAGFTIPTAYDMDDPEFRAWIRWRHINMAGFLNDVREAAHTINPEFAVVIENFPMDYMDGTAYGLDGTYVPQEDNLISIWETDSVSNTQAMQWATPDDFENKLAMLKWGKGIHPGQPSWSFSYGYEPLDASLTLAATVATQNVPFEAKTPSMLSTVDTGLRQRWFGYVRDHEEELFRAPRQPEIAIWYSSATRDFQDYAVSGKFGIFSVTTPPTEDETWWAKRPGDSVVSAPHLGGYRGLSAAMMRMNIPYTVVHGRDAGPLASINSLDMLLLPSVGVLSDADAEFIRNFVSDGGTLLATGTLPGTLDETGAARATNVLADVFDFQGTGEARFNRFGAGIAIYRPDIVGTTLFGEQLDARVAADTLSELEKLVRIHVDEPFTVVDGDDLFVERAVVDDNEHLLYVVNYSGLQLPLVQSVKTVTIHYKAPPSKLVTTVVASTPDTDGLNGFATVSHRGHGIYAIELPVDQFALLKIQLNDAPMVAPVDYAGPQFTDPEHAEAAQSGLAFVLEHMRDSNAPEPNRFGVYTNLLDNDSSTEIYTNGHNVTGEHMGLLLRTSACMGDENAFNEAYRYAAELMQSPLYHVPNWSIDKNSQRPFLFYDDFNDNWYNANAPLDDLRLIQGLMDGYENFANESANALADEMLEGLYWTTVTDRGRNSNETLFPEYSGGLLGFAWDWAEVDDATLTPNSRATGTGYLGTDLIPVDYQDLGGIVRGAERDYRWQSVLQATTQLLLDSEINLSGLYYNGYRPDGTWTGDFEYQGTRRGEHLKVIQVLWTAIHLARVSKTTQEALGETQKSLAAASAARSLTFFKDFYAAEGRIPEYLTVTGADVDDCINGPSGNCLDRGGENLFDGEARIYAQVSRLALLLGDNSFANQIINEKIISDRISDTGDLRYGMIGVSTAGTNDAEAWNVLESVFSLCLNAINDDVVGPPVDNNNPPVAVRDQFNTDEQTALTLTATDLLSNDTDADNDTLFISGVPNRSTEGGSVRLLDSGDWLYTPSTTFTGIDSISYAISDGQGGTAIGQIEIDVRIVPKTTHLTESVNILTGALNYGSVEFLSVDDTDTYDVDSAPAVEGNLIDWVIKGNIARHSEVSRLIMTYSGHYSVRNVTQELLMFNVVENDWVSMDTRTVGDESDSIVRIDLTENPQQFIAADGETRVRIRAIHATQAATIWANSIQWLAYRGLEADNTAPQAFAVSATTTIDNQTPVTLTGYDADADPLTYSIDTQGLVGTISGLAPNLTYAPPPGYSGTDAFSYTVSDGEQTSSPATVSLTILSPGVISNRAAAMTLDGNLEEWSGFMAFPADAQDVDAADNPLDWYEAWMAHSGEHYYLAYQNNGPVNVSWGQTIYFDIDDNSATGAQFGLPFGADRVLQGRFLYRYTGTGNDWSWAFITEVEGRADNGRFEYRFPRTALDGSEQIKLVFVGSNEPYGGNIEDLHPDGVYDNSAVDRFFNYTATVPDNTAPDAFDLELITSQDTPLEFMLDARDSDGDTLQYVILSQPQQGSLSGTEPNLVYQPAADYVGADALTFQVNDGQEQSRIATVSINVQSDDQSTVPSNPVTGIVIDGMLDEWQTLRAFADDPDDISGAENPVDYRTAAMAHDSTYFYLSFSNDGQDLTLLQDWLFTIYMDTDGNPETGYRSGLAIGADIMQQGGAVFRYNGTGLDWTWTAIAPTPRAADNQNVELAIPRQIIGDPDEIRLAMIGDNLSIGGGMEDVMPDGTYNANSAIRFLRYSSGGTPSQPLELGAALGDDVVPISGRQNLINSPVQIVVSAEQGPATPSGGDQNSEESSSKRSDGIGVFGVATLLFLLLVALRSKGILRTERSNIH